MECRLDNFFLVKFVNVKRGQLKLFKTVTVVCGLWRHFVGILVCLISLHNVV